MEELLILKARFGMSVQALLKRFSDLNIISQTSYKWSCIHLNQLNWRKNEPHPIEPEKPMWLRQSALRCLAEGFITLAEAEKLLGEKLNEKEAPSSLRNRAFARLPIEERRRILEEQSEQIRKHYEEDESWRLLQGGDFVELK